MKKFTFLLSLLAMVLCNVQSAFADDAKWTDKYIQSVDAAVTSSNNLKEGFYLMRNVGHSTFLREENNGNLYLANVNNYSSEIANIQENFIGQASSDKLNYVVYLTKDTDGTYKIQFKSGKYMPNFGSGSTSSNQTASKLTFAIYGEGESYFNFKDGTGLYANGKGGDLIHGAGPGPGNFVGWGKTPSDKTGNGSYQLYPVTLANVITATYDYKVNNHIVLEATKKVIPGTTVSAEGYPCLTINSCDKTTFPNENCTVNVDCSMNLPFELSTTEAPKYYAIKMHTGNRMMVADDTNSQVACYEVSTSLPELPKLNQWAFIGTDAFTSFKLYNKATKKYLKSSASNTIATLVDEAEASTFHVMATRIQNMTNGFCISNNSYYLNYQNPDNSNKPGVYGYSDNDQGSTCTVFTPASFPLNYASTYANAPEGAISGKVYLETADNLADLKDAYNAVSKHPTEDYINALVTINKAIEASAASTFKAGYYRLVNRKDNKFLHIDGSNIMNTQAGKDKAVGSVVYFKSAGESTYNLMMEGLYFGTVTKSQNIVLGNEANKGTYTIEFFANKPVAKIHESTNSAGEDDLHYLHVNGGNAVGWEASESSPASHWYVIPATDIEVAMNAVEGKSYATAYLPFGVSAVKDAKAYVAAAPVNNETVMTETASFGAKTGVLLVSDNAADKAVLTIGDVTSEVTSALSGTLLAKDITDQTNYLVFGKNKAAETEVGFFEPSTSVTSIPANRAFFEGVASAAIALNFGGNVTAIDQVVNNANVNAPIFDLAGRRVVKAVKGGLYIQNGKKYIVK